MSVEVTIDSAVGKGYVKPLIGKISHPTGTRLVVEVTKRTFTEDDKVWTYKGFTGTGDAPLTGQSTIVDFSPSKNSTISFNWDSTNLKYQWLGQVTSIVAIIIVLGISFAGYYIWQRPFIVAIFAGALGGLLHEMVQSGGKYILPNCDESGNFVLGGLIGVITGGVAGLLLYQGLLGAPVNVDAKLAVGAILAGLAVKGIADAPNPK